MSAEMICRTFGERGIRDYAPAYGRLGAITDDTQMTLFTAEGLLRYHVRLVLHGIARVENQVDRAYLRWLMTQGHDSPLLHEGGEPDGWLITHRELFDQRGPGSTCLSALKTKRRSGERAENDSKGCGGVIRVAPVGMDAATEGAHESRPDLVETVFSMGASIAALTHGHPAGQLPAGVMATLVYLLLGGMDIGGAVKIAAKVLRVKRGHEETLTALERAVELAASRPGRSDALSRFGEGWVAEEALAIGVYCALGATDFESGVVLAVNHGGDSDSTGSIAGNLLGARFGAEAIPERWLGPLELRDVISAMADDLATSPEWQFDSHEDTPEKEFYWRRYPGW